MSDGRPTYELGGRGDPVLGGMPFLIRAQVVQKINQQLLTELVDHFGGEVILPPGFRERVGENKRTITTRFIDGGFYKVWTVDMPKEIIHIGLGTRWERMEGPRRREQEPHFYLVVGEAVGGHVEMQRIDGDGVPLSSPLLKVNVETLKNGGGGWRPMAVSLGVIEGAAGAETVDGGGDV